MYYLSLKNSGRKKLSSGSETGILHCSSSDEKLGSSGTEGTVEGVGVILRNSI